jgi:hypothetical protein
MATTLSADETAARARSELARHAITARWAKTSPEERRRVTLPARISGAVRLISEHADQLSEEQTDQLLDAVYGTERYR